MARQLPVALTRAQVERSPDIDTRKPVSRQHEAEYFGYYGYPYYWGGAGLWGMGAYPGSLTTEDRIEEELKGHADSATATPDDCHLRSSNAVIGHHIEATDGDIGHVEDLLVDDHTWAIRYLIVDTSNWWGGHRVLVAPRWITDVSWSEAKVSVDLTRQAVRDAPRTTRRHKSIARSTKPSTSTTIVLVIGSRALHGAHRRTKSAMPIPEGPSTSPAMRDRQTCHSARRVI